jgi:hypothetical protein
MIMGYGYDPWRILVPGIQLVLIGFFVFQFGYTSGLITPTKAYNRGNETPGSPISDGYPKFNSLGYSLETLIPFLKLGIDDYWALNKDRTRAGSFVRLYRLIHLLAGRLLMILLVVALIGVIVT